MRIKPEFDNASIVLLGSFNPRIFQPAWFARHGMIGEKEAEKTVMLLQNKEECAFGVDTFELKVRLDHFLVTGVGDHPEHIKDLVISCFGKYLPHTPVVAMGINRNIHFDTGDFEVRDRVGSRLAPKDAWGEWGKEIQKSYDAPIYERGGMLSITMLQKNLQQVGEYDSSVQAQVEPSIKIEGNTGIFVGVSNQFQLMDNEKSVQNASLAVEALEANWETSMKRAAIIVDQIMALTEEYRT